MPTFNSKEDFRNRILSKQDKSSQCLTLHRFIATIIQEKYKDVDVTIDISAYGPDKVSEFVVIDNKTQKVLESFQDEDSFNCNILDMVYNHDSGESKLDVTDEREFERIWQLYRLVEPEETNEDKSFETIPTNEILWIDINLIEPNPFQIRENFDDVPELAHNIKEIGMIYPISVKLEGEKYIIVDGERRFRAVKSLGWKNIRAIQVSDTADLDSLSLTGNFNRSNPNAIATGRKIASIRVQIKKTNKWARYEGIIPEEKRLSLNLDDPFSSCKEIDELIGKETGFSRTQQYNLVRLLREPDDIQDKIRKGELCKEEGTVTINLSNDLPEEFVRALKTAEQRKQTIEQIERWARDTNDPNTKLLKYFSQLEKVGERYKVGYSYYDKADEKTQSDIRERVVNHITQLCETFGIKHTIFKEG